MRLQTVSLQAIAVAVLPLNPHQVSFNEYPILYMSKSTSGTNTAQVDATISELGVNIPVTISQTTTAVTVTFPVAQPHRLGSSADYITISGSGLTGVDGTFPVTSVTSDTVLVYTSGTSQSVTGAAYAVPMRTVTNVIASGTPPTTALPATSLVGSSATTIPVGRIPYSALILKVTAFGSGGTIYLDVRENGIV